MPWIAGQQLQRGKYVVEGVLGQGGFGITYKALQVSLNRRVVIKTPNEHLSYDPEYKKYLERFVKEAQTLASLSQDPNPHIVGMIDLFQESNTYCLVMDFVEGENLFESVRRRGILPEAEIVTYVCQIGEALSKVHQAGLVHRDAHPGNIMLRRNGKAVLIDFGIAKGLVPQSMSSTNKAGNEGFAPYEQMTRGSREPTVDVYCLAATLYYAVTGKPPTTSLARKLDNVPLTPPKRIISSISDRLNKAILKGMELEPKDRPQTMQAWLTMLEVPKPNTKAIPDNPASHSPRTTSWLRLFSVSLSYLYLGYLSGTPDVSLQSVTWSWVLSLVWALAVAWAVNLSLRKGLSVVVAWAIVLSVGLGLGVIVTLAGGGSVAWGVATAWAVAVAWAWLWIGAKEKLQQHFREFPALLILVATSILSSTFGWAIY
ncbi:serine/threonine-protein kinase, partial [Nostoc sp. NIES-2111]